MTVDVSGEPATLSVGSQREILVNGLPCPDLTDVDSPPRVATVDDAGAIAVGGTDAADLVVIDQTGAGGPFPPVLSFRLDLGFDDGDGLRVIGLPEDDAISAVASSLYLAPSLGNLVTLGGVDAVEVDAGAGDDTVDASLRDVDAGSFSLPITIRGGEGDDTLTGGDGDDRIFGEGGNDVLDGLGGTDFLNGGPDVDRCRYGDALLSCDPVLELAPSEGTAGTPVVAGGTGWYPENGEVAISFGGGEPQVGVQPAPDGSIATSELAVPPAADGSTSVAVAGCQGCSTPGLDPVQDTTDFAYTAVIYELTLEVTPDPVPAGGPVSVSGTGWYAGEPVGLYLDPAGAELDDAFATPVANEDGLFNGSFDLPDSAATGPHRLLACQRCGTDGERRAQAEFRVEVVEVTPTIDVRSETVAAGDAMHVVGFGWDRALGRVHVSIASPTTDEVELDAFRPDPIGEFDRSIEVPDLPAGSYTVVACQRCGSPDRVDDTDEVAIADGALPLPWIVGVAVAFLLVVGAIVLLVRRAAAPAKTGSPPGARVRAEARPAPPEVTVSRVPDGTTDHRIRLVPRPDRGDQRVEEMSSR